MSEPVTAAVAITTDIILKRRRKASNVRLCVYLALFLLVAWSVQVTIIDDTTDEPDPELILTLTDPQNVALGQEVAHTLTILDDDDPSVVDFSVGTQSVTEGAKTFSADFEDKSTKVFLLVPKE